MASPAQPLSPGDPWRGRAAMRSLAISCILTLAATAVLVTGVVLWSAAESDRSAKARFAQKVAYAISQGLDKIPYDQESVANWDDAVINARTRFNAAWVDVNLGVWMYDYFQHDRVKILDANNEILYAMADGKRIPTLDRRAPPVVAALAGEVRGKIANGALEDYAQGKTRIPRAVDIGMVEQRPAIVSVMPLLPHSSAVTQEKGTESLIASVRFLDSSFLTSLEKALLLDGIRYTREDVGRSYEQSHPIESRSGATVGYIVWAPRLPGSDILAHVLPVLAAGFGLVCLSVAALIRRLRRTYTELVTSEAQARHLACRDSLTGLANRAFFNTCLERALSEVETSDEELALLFLDLDRFKQVNDTLGHAAGDALIRELANTISAMLKPGDVMARMGGDEFAILIRNVVERLEVEQLCRDIIGAVSRPFEVVGGQAVVGISIGIALASAAQRTERSELAREADIALYEAKRGGGQRCQVFTPELNAAALQQRELEVELRHAIEGGREIDVAYQPIYASGCLEIAGVEALARWSHPRLGAVSPLVFIAVAEDCGLIHQLGELVLKRACRTAHLLDLASVSVNVSSLQLQRPDFARRVLDILTDIGLPPSRLEIEVTERALLDVTSAGARTLRALRNAGVHVALDDFGTGQSALGALMKLEVDRIKIDTVLVRSLGEIAQSGSIAEAMVRMAHAVGIAVTAEGVETSEQLALLTRIGADHLQGHLLSPPISAARLSDLIRSANTTASDVAREVA